MQYAQIVPNRKLDPAIPFFTYKIPPEILPKIKIGSLVEIPLGKTKTEGIVLGIKKIAKGLGKEKLKPITKLLYDEPLIDEMQIKLSKWMSDKYIAPLSLCLFEMIPLPPKKATRAKTNQIKSKAYPQITAPYLSSIAKICEKVLSKNKKVILITPTIAQAEVVSNHLNQRFKNRVALYKSELPASKRFKNYLEIKQGKFDIVVGSRLGIFTPLRPLGAIIITDEIGGAYKNERSPRYNLISVAQKLSQITSSKLIILNQVPKVEIFYRSKKDGFYLLSPKTAAKPPKTKIIDSKNEFKKGNYSPLSEELQEVIKWSYQKEKQIILFTARRGTASYIFCRNCGYVVKCPNCELPLTYHLASNQLFCHHCNFKQEILNLCPNCQDLNIKYSGTGTQRIETEIKKLLPKPQIARIDQDTKPGCVPKNAHIIIGTPKIFTQFNQKVPVVAVVSIDSLLNLPDFNIGEEIYKTIFRLQSFAALLFIVQTYHPDNFIINTAVKNDFQTFYQKELEERKKFDFPPFSTLIKLIYQHKNEEKAKKESSLLAERLNLVVSNLSLDISLSGPSPCFYHKLRGKYRWQILIKIKYKKSKIKNLFNLLKTLPREWIVDVEPKTLL